METFQTSLQELLLYRGTLIRPESSLTTKGLDVVNVRVLCGSVIFLDRAHNIKNKKNNQATHDTKKLTSATSRQRFTGSQYHSKTVTK